MRWRFCFFFRIEAQSGVSSVVGKGAWIFGRWRLQVQTKSFSAFAGHRLKSSSQSWGATTQPLAKRGSLPTRGETLVYMPTPLLRRLWQAQTMHSQAAANSQAAPAFPTPRFHTIGNITYLPTSVHDTSFCQRPVGSQIACCCRALACSFIFFFDSDSRCARESFPHQARCMPNGATVSCFELFCPIRSLPTYLTFRGAARKLHRNKTLRAFPSVQC